MNRSLPLALAFAFAFSFSFSGCAHPPETKNAVVSELPRSLERRIEVDTQRLARGPDRDQWTVAGFVEKHLAVEGLIRPGKTREDTLTLMVDLPTPGYALRARIEPRPEQFCRVTLDVIATDRGDQPVEKAPWWAIRALESVGRGIDTLGPPKRPPMDDVRFARLHAAASKLRGSDEDPPITMEDYIHSPRPLVAGAAEEYFAPPTGPSQIAPR
jgi:hypothetical protein